MSSQNKQDIRRNVRREIAALDHEERERASAQIFSHIVSLDCLKRAKTIALFASLHDEPQSADFIAQISTTKRVVLPRIEGNEMEFYDISQGVQLGAFGIMEPLATTAIDPSEIDVMVVPGVAFTRRGERCGRGKGFYDRYISRAGFRAFTVGVCFPCQVVEELPVEAHDKRVDRVIF